MTRVVLKRPHTHAGKSYGDGERLAVDAATAEWLLNHDVAAPDPKPDLRPAKTEPEPKPLPSKESKP